jgi:phage protein D
VLFGGSGSDPSLRIPRAIAKRITAKTGDSSTTVAAISPAVIASNGVTADAADIKVRGVVIPWVRQTAC